LNQTKAYQGGDYLTSLPEKNHLKTGKSSHLETIHTWP
jgi:hypothetical protein